ncbi:MAG: transposase [Brevinematales bacterium]
MENLSYEMIQNMSEKECEKLFFTLRWPNGFVCPRCGHTHAKKITSRKLWRCTNCQTQVSLKSGTILHGSHLSIKQWLLAVALLTDDTGISAQNLKKHFKVAYETAWLLLHKIRQALYFQEATKDNHTLLIVTIYFLPGIQKKQKKEHGPYPVIETTPSGTPFPVKLTLVPSHKERNLGLSQKSAYLQKKKVVFNLPDWGHILMKKAKTILATTYHYGCRKHIQRYLDEIAYRWNRTKEKRVTAAFTALVECGKRTYREFVAEPMVRVV